MVQKRLPFSRDQGHEGCPPRMLRIARVFILESTGQYVSFTRCGSGLIDKVDLSLSLGRETKAHDTVESPVSRHLLSMED